MSKINLTDQGSLANETVFLSSLNANWAEIEASSDDFLSRSGESPNTMLADLDMNNHDIINLPAPIQATSPVRLIDLTGAIPSITVSILSDFTLTSNASITGTYSVVSGDNTKQMIFTGNAFYTISVGAAAGYPAGFFVKLINGDTGRCKRVTITGWLDEHSNNTFLLLPKQEVIVYKVGSDWVVVKPNHRWRIFNPTLYVDPINGSNLNDGLAPGSGAFLTIQAAVDFAISNGDRDTTASNFGIQLADGTYTLTEPVRIYTPPIGSTTSLGINGNAITPGNVVVQSTVGCFDVQDYGSCAITNLRVKGLGVGASLIRSRQHTITDLENIEFDTSPSGVGISSTDLSSFNGGTNCKILGDMGVFAQCAGLSQMYLPLNIDIPNARTFTVFATVGGNSHMGASTSINFTGSGATTSTGIRYSVNDEGWLSIPNKDSFPGNGLGQFYRKGISNADVAPIGSVGEEITSLIVSGSAVGLTTGVAANVTSISLTAGEWQVNGKAIFKGGATTQAQTLQSSVSTTTATMNLDGNNFGVTSYPASYVAFVNGDNAVHTGPVWLHLNATTTVYLVVSATFTTSTCSAWGVLKAKRMR